MRPVDPARARAELATIGAGHPAAV
jgi:hypothetical protein